jgi:NADH:ubiquinone oxidoreductase subunit 4 (subunit M)
MYWQPSPAQEPVRISMLSRAIMILLMIATILFGVYPQPVLNALKSGDRSVAKIDNH